MQAVALAEVHVRVDEPPLSTVVGVALIEAVGTGLTGSPPLAPQAASASETPAINKALKDFTLHIPFYQSVKRQFAALFTQPCVCRGDLGKLPSSASDSHHEAEICHGSWSIAGASWLQIA
jgi:hypothetical protein